MPNTNTQWYVIHTYSGHEKKVAETLKQRIEAANLKDKIQELFVPTQKKIIALRGEKKEIEEKLFPGYILLKMVVDDETWPVVRNTAGVTGFVGVEGKPTPLPQEEIEGIQKFIELEVPKFEAKFKKGDSVKIVDGPFSDFVGKVE